MRKTFKRTLSLLLATITILTSCIGLSVNAAQYSGSLNWETGSEQAIYESYTKTFGTYDSRYARHPRSMSYNGITVAAYCIEPYAATTAGGGYTIFEDSSLSEDIKKPLGDILHFGYKSSDIKSVDAKAKWAATQVAVYLAIKGVYGEPEALQDARTVLSNSINPSVALSFFNNLVNSIEAKYFIPSFASKNQSTAPTVELKWNPDNERFERTFDIGTELNEKFTFTAEGFTFEKKGSDLTVYTAEAIEGETMAEGVWAEAPGGPDAVIAWKYSPNASSQNMGTCKAHGENAYDPVSAFFKLKTGEVTTGKLQKIIEERHIDEEGEYRTAEGLKFRITGGGISQTFTTDANGHAEVKGLPVAAVNPDGEEQPDVPIDYTIEEVDTPIEYVIPPAVTVTAKPGDDIEFSMENRLKKWRVTVTKQDSEFPNRPQGDATLAGAVYGIYKNGTLKETYITDVGGKFTTRYFLCGSGWTLREITPSEGYLLDETVYNVGMTPGTTLIEYNNTTQTVKEDVKKGTIEIVKSIYEIFEDNGQLIGSEIGVPEEGAEFEIFLASSGSYEAAYETERDILTINEQGVAFSKPLPYGLYCIVQTKGWEGYEFVMPFYINIQEHEKLYVGNPINTPIFNDVYIQKRDAETGKVVPALGVGFMVKNVDTGEWVMQRTNYPTPQDHKIFYTDINGRLMLPSKLKYGNYAVYEVKSPDGYVLSSEPIPFSIKSSEPVYIIVDVYNNPQKGVINIEKQSEVFASVRENEKEGTYEPVYKLQGRPDAVYEITAAEDIRTPDGTLRVPKGELVDTITTNEKGKAASKELYLGLYKIVEITAPDGMTINDSPQYVRIEYAGQEVAVTSVDVGFENERQKVEVGFEKFIEDDENYGIGMNDEYENIFFGLFAAEDIKALDGKVIPKDGLIDVVGVDMFSQVQFKTDVPFGKYYIQEIETDEHYILSNEKFHFEFSYQGQDIEVVELTINNGKVRNIMIRGSIEGKKFGEEGQWLEGALIGIFPKGTLEFTEDTACKTYLTGKEGTFKFDDIPFGNWVIREISAPVGFEVNETEYPITIKEDGQKLPDFKIVNKYIVSDIEGIKYAELDFTEDDAYAEAQGDIKAERTIPVDEFKVERGSTLEGVTFGLFLADETSFTKETALDISVTNKDGRFVFEKVHYGDYLVKELETLDGFVLIDGEYPVTVDGTQEIIEIKAINEFTKVHISKIDITNGNELPGAEMEIKSADGKTIHKWTSSDKLYLFEALPAGDYVLIETIAPEGFKIAEDITFTVEETGEIQTVTMKDERKAKPTPQTGLRGPVVAILSLIVSLALIAILLLKKRFKKR